MDHLIDFSGLEHQAMAFSAIAEHYLTSARFLWQAGAIISSGLLSLGIGPKLRRMLARIPASKTLPGTQRLLISVLSAIAVSGLWFLLLWISLNIATQAHLARHFLKIAVNLVGAWVVIRGCARIVRNPLLSNAIFVIAWGFAALNILGLLGPLLSDLDSLGFNFGSQKITGVTVLKGAVAFVLLLWAAMTAARFVSDRIKTVAQLTPTLQILLAKLIQFVFVALAVVLALQVMGIPLTAFAIFGGAIGIGIGLGLQKAASNVISGLMLLMDKSVKPGDVVSVGDTFGWVTSLGGRYVGVRTRDGIEHLIPNEVFVSHGVENWSHTERAVRLKLPFGISYASDPHAAIAVAIEAAKTIERVLKYPEPTCLLTSFGDSAINLELRVWINDPENGVGNVKSQIFLKLWDGLKAS
ncbi:MAG TPA: mechanosensitive ion channel domain-containing protein, partial [Alphaproteobacteria bacterium]|nr:mechanosensitive ion channel domain-containing protein [Alphaproteobacteria bacterium]